MPNIFSTTSYDFDGQPNKTENQSHNKTGGYFSVMRKGKSAIFDGQNTLSFSYYCLMNMKITKIKTKQRITKSMREGRRKA